MLLPFNLQELDLKAGRKSATFLVSHLQEIGCSVCLNIKIRKEAGVGCMTMTMMMIQPGGALAAWYGRDEVMASGGTERVGHGFEIIQLGI